MKCIAKGRRACRWALAALAALPGLAGLAGCAALQDAPRLSYACPNALSFEARLYQDMALLEGLRGHAVLERLPLAGSSVAARPMRRGMPSRT